MWSQTRHPSATSTSPGDALRSADALPAVVHTRAAAAAPKSAPAPGIAGIEDLLRCTDAAVRATFQARADSAAGRRVDTKDTGDCVLAGIVDGFCAIAGVADRPRLESHRDGAVWGARMAMAMHDARRDERSLDATAVRDCMELISILTKRLSDPSHAPRSV